MQYVVDVTFEVFSDVDKSLINVDAMNQSSECPQEGGKQGTMSKYELESSFKDDEASLQEDVKREAMSPPHNDGAPHDRRSLMTEEVTP